MAGRWPSIISCIIFIFCFNDVIRGTPRSSFIDEPNDTVYTDTLDITVDADADIDKKEKTISKPAMSPADSTRDTTGVGLYEPVEKDSYYLSYVSSKGLGDYLRYQTGIFSFQHGSIGQPEMVTESVMLPGLPATYNGLPVFHQGSFFPLRSGPDLNVLVSDNIYAIDIMPLSYLSLLSEGQTLALRSMVWPPEENPSSVTVAQGPYDYEKSAWRFSRRLAKTVAGSFTAAFKESGGYYALGADYDDFRISGSFVWRPRINTEIQYAFYQHKAKQGLLQFDRLVTPTIRSHNDINHHAVKMLYQPSDKILFNFEVFRQKNYNRIFDNTNVYSDLNREYLHGGLTSVNFVAGNHLFELGLGGRQHRIAGIGTEPTSRTIAALLSDSLTLGNAHVFKLSGRIRYNNKTDLGLAGTAIYRIRNLSLAFGALDYEPDIYAMYYHHPQLNFDQQSLIRSYRYIADPDLKPKKTLFGSSGFHIDAAAWLGGDINVSFEKVYNDLVPVVEGTDSIWTSSQHNIDYDRLTATFDLAYNITGYFTGKSGLTFFHYNPGDVLPGIKHSPSLIAFSQGEFKVREVLRDIDLSSAFQVRYYSKRYYAGFSSVLLDRYEYKQAIVIDGSLAIHFGSFEFRITEDNILDYLTDNNYELWGEYTMPPGMVWWQFTWNFYN